MSSSAVATVTKILESLPESAQERVADHLREYIEDLRDELQWDHSFATTQNKLGEAGRRAKEQIRAGRAEPLDPDKL
ncbi:MAG: hypothetical protein ACR2IE_08680 [Candidatus Sumerlaeaceae bacterium]